MKMDELAKKLDEMGWALTYALDPVDGSRIVVLVWNEVAGLVADYEEIIEGLRGNDTSQ